MVRLISFDGKQLGIVSIQDALRIAGEEGLDLVEVAPNSDPPVCRIMDYGKFKYETSKKAQEARKKSRAFQLKEIKLRPHTEDHDLGFKLKNIRKFLSQRNRVKVTVFFSGQGNGLYGCRLPPPETGGRGSGGTGIGGAGAGEGGQKPDEHGPCSQVDPPRFSEYDMETGPGWRRAGPSGEIR